MWERKLFQLSCNWWFGEEGDNEMKPGGPVEINCPGVSLLSPTTAAGSRGTMWRLFRTWLKQWGLWGLEHRLERTVAGAGTVAELELSCACSGSCSSPADVQSSSCELHQPWQDESRFPWQDGAWW